MIGTKMISSPISPVILVVIVIVTLVLISLLAVLPKPKLHLAAAIGAAFRIGKSFGSEKPLFPRVKHELFIAILADQQAIAGAQCLFSGSKPKYLLYYVEKAHLKLLLFS